MIKKIDTKAARVRRHARVRKNISGISGETSSKRIQKCKTYICSGY